LENDFIRILCVPGVFYSEKYDITVALHGDHFISESTVEGQTVLDRILTDNFDIKCLGRVGALGGTRARFLKRIVGWNGEAFYWCGDRSHIDRLVELLALEGAEAVPTPASRTTGDNDREALDTLCRREAETARQAAGLLQYIALDRPDIQYPVMVIMRNAAKPIKIMMLRIRRVARYLIGRPVLMWLYPLQSLPGEVTALADAGYAAKETERRSTTCICDLFGKHTLDTSSTTQSVVALSTGESEFHAIVKGGASVMQTRALLEELGLKVRAVVCSDATAGLGMARRHGSGRVKHMDVRLMWIQEKVRTKELDPQKVGTEVNGADLGTKVHERPRLDVLVGLLGLRFAEGLPEAVS